MPARPGRRRWRRALAGALALVAVVSVCGWAYETLARRGDPARYPAPGRLVDVGGHRLRLDCTGPRGSGPTVVFEAGLGESGLTWARVQQEVSGPSSGGGLRACSYDRAGYAWSEPGPGPRDAGRLAGELHALLGASGERGPYVLVAHSYGGNVTRVFADRWPALTAGLVLVDVTDEQGVGELRMAERLLGVQTAVYGVAARVGVVRLFGSRLVPGGTPEVARRQAAVVYGAGTIATSGAEGATSVDSARQVQATVRPGAWGARPVVVIASSGQPEEAYDHYAALARLSSRGRFVRAATADHYVHYAQPDLVADAVRDVVAGAFSPPPR
ncbi:alpha/beta fold hydrolase [Sphaerisporangium fuscum]|uniref:alpha/beta fold hydrolase n=1 Tax=Sphaerisporangium fuscum TaxID=2835868 RepID=UPI001BDC3480|nr:alpha/beta hydrolase [Sphaerisporangium fuscum]